MNDKRVRKDFFKRVKRYSIHNTVDYLPRYFQLTVMQKIKNKKVFRSSVWYKMHESYTGSHVAALKGHYDTIRCISFSPLGEYLASSGNDWNAFIFAIDVLNKKNFGKIVAKLEDHSDKVLSISFSSSGNYLVTGGAESLCMIYELKYPKERHLGGLTATLITKLSDHNSSVVGTCFSPLDNLLITGELKEKLIFYNFEAVKINPQVKKMMTLELAAQLSCMCFSPTGDYIAVGCLDNRAYIFGSNPKRDTFGKRLCRFFRHEDKVRSVNFSPDGQYIITSSIKDTYFHAMKFKSSLSDSQIKHFSSGCFSPSGQYLVKGLSGDTMIINGNNPFQEDEYDEKKVIQVDTKSNINCCSFSPIGNFVAVGLNKGSDIQIYC